jgi:LPS-assembly lipoprotein
MMARRTLRLALATALILPLAACGFEPIYARHDATMAPAVAGLGDIAVGVLGERTGQELRQALQARFDRAGGGLAPRYDLTINYGLTSEGVGYQPDTSISRIRLVGTAAWTLTAQDAQRSTLASGTSRVVDGYDNLDNQLFAANMQDETVKKRIAGNLADQITLQLSIWFKQHAPQG